MYAVFVAGENIVLHKLVRNVTFPVVNEFTLKIVKINHVNIFKNK